MSYAHETCCAHLKIQYCKESLGGPTHDWWECASCKMLFAPQGRTSLPQWIPISERMPTREDADELGEVVWKWAHGGTSAARFGSHPEGAVAWLPLPRYTPPKPGPTDEELDALLNQLASAHGTSYPRHIARDWFASVTARIQREAGG